MCSRSTPPSPLPSSTPSNPAQRKACQYLSENNTPYTINLRHNILKNWTLPVYPPAGSCWSGPCWHLPPPFSDRVITGQAHFLTGVSGCHCCLRFQFFYIGSISWSSCILRTYGIKDIKHDGRNTGHIVCNYLKTSCMCDTHLRQVKDPCPPQSPRTPLHINYVI